MIVNEKFANWSTLFFHYLRRDWKKLIFWIAGLGTFASAYVPAFQEIAKDGGGVGLFETMENPAITVMVGPSPVKEGVDYTVGAMYGHEMVLFCGVFALIVAALHVVGHTRKEEEQGLTELIRSFQVGRQANSLAVFIETAVVSLVLGSFITGFMMSYDVPSITTEGAIIFGLSVGLAGGLGAALALVAVQLMPSASSATGVILSIVGVLYILRGYTDLANLDLSMLNPLGWIYLTYPFVENNYFPIVLSLVFILALVVLAFVLEEHRDLGAGYLPQRNGRLEAPKRLLSVPGLLLRLNFGVILSWLTGYTVLGVAYGSIYGDIQSFLESNDLIKQMFTVSGISIEESFTGTIMMIVAILVAILPVVLVNKLYKEESQRHLSQLYATKVSRAKLYWTTIGLALVASVLGLVLGAGSLGLTALTVMDHASAMELSDFFLAGVNYLPVIGIYLGLATVALGWRPGLGKLVYAYLGFSFVLNYFSGIVDVPEWLLNSAVLSWVPRMSIDAFDLTVCLVLSAISITLLLLGYLGYRYRDLIEND